MKQATPLSLKAIKVAEKKDLATLKKVLEANLFSCMTKRLMSEKKKLAEAYFIDEDNLFDELSLMAMSNYGDLFNKQDTEGIIRAVIADARKMGKEALDDELHILTPKLRQFITAKWKQMAQDEKRRW